MIKDKLQYINKYLNSELLVLKRYNPLTENVKLISKTKKIFHIVIDNNSILLYCP